MADDERLVCASTELQEGSDGVRFTIECHGVAEPAFVVRHAGKVHAYFNRCGHVGVELDWQPGRFFDDSGLYLICSTHGALYAPENGRCLDGPCNGKGLTTIPIVERDGHIYLKE